jgi:murein DD-endopeptidase MepM/ murein hydrolase activator NlpD
MSKHNSQHAKFVVRGLVLAAASFSLAACSSSVDRFGNAYPPVNTASVPAKPTTQGVTRQRLAGSPAQGAVRPSWQQPTGSYTAPRRTAAYKAPTYSAPTYKAPVRKTTASYARTNGSVTVQSGQTMYSLARANGLSVSQLASANGIAYPYTLKVGQRLTIPGVASPTSPAPSFTPRQPAYRAANAPAPKRQNYAAQSSGGHTVKPGETLFSLGRTYGQNPYRIAKYNNLSAPYGLNVGQVLRIPGKSNHVAANTPIYQKKASAPFARKPVQSSKTRKMADRITPAPTTPVQRTQQAPKTQAPVVQTSNSTFRWPVKGRVISSFGRKPSGMRNEGINIAVPEGTSVRSAESGIVAYAGNELKGYGNLVLVRHKNGWVTAYAHNKQLFVKRGDTVKRGTVIAKAGQTGSVKSPQLHFEVRKGSSAVDPMKYLTSRTAAN